MRNVKILSHGWNFTKPGCETIEVTVPHTWNAQDGTDGGNDYYRGTCRYERTLRRPALAAGEQVWLEFDGVAQSCVVFVNGIKVTEHQGGYSTFRCDVTAFLKEGDNTLTVDVDNGKNDRVYPQKADFTFYGGIYREVKQIVVPAAHFALGYWGGSGVKITPTVEGRNARVLAQAWIEGDAEAVSFTIDGQTKTAPVENGKAEAEFLLTEVHLWNGVADPYLYTCTASLPGDEVRVRFGCRTIAFDPDKGFLLNGTPYRLCGAARHQDRQGLGNALTEKEHAEDIALLLEMGANTVRLAHYQQAQIVYDLCDEKGLIAWAEIPYITEHLPAARENSLSQMRELVVQNYNHPSIVCWGLSNEITATGGVNDDMVENHRLLNDLCHELDKTRPTTMAHVFMLDANDPFVMLPDIRSYNLYYGWYVGDWDQNDEWFDQFHDAHPDAVIGLSEYGADANPAYQAEHPEKGDWTEGYQALYHEHMLKMWSERPYIWAMHCWNMFDFGADGRDEGGKPGQNQKGLVTFDRKTKKDAFYIYKAYLSKEPFVHLCGRRYTDRTGDKTEIRVYSNQPEVTLLVDGKEAGRQTGDKVFVFTVPLAGEHEIEARAGAVTDTMIIRRVDKPNPDYVKAGGQIVNWFDREGEIVREGYFSIKNSVAEIRANPAAEKVFEEMVAPLKEKAVAAYGDVAKNIQMPESVVRAMERMSVEATLKQLGALITPEFVHKLNAVLNKIPRN